MNLKSKLANIVALGLLSSTLVFTNPASATGCSTTSFQSGSGSSASDPFIVTTATHFSNIRRCDGLAKHFSVRSDISLSGFSFTPIGDFSDRFISSLKGEVFENGTTRSARITGYDITSSDAGVFGTVGSGAKISDLYFEGRVTGTEVAGGVIAQVVPNAAPATVLLENLEVAASVTGATWLGGIVGYVGTGLNADSTGVLTISGSRTVVANGFGVVQGTLDRTGTIGGFVGGGRGASKIVIRDSVAGNILTSARSSSVVYFGGFVGGTFNVGLEFLRAGSSVIIHRSNPVASTATSDIGGFVGTPPSDNIALKIEQSYFDGLISFRDRSKVGGFLATTTPTGTIQITDSYSSGYIIYDPIFGPATSQTQVGGIFGSAGKAVTQTRVISNTRMEVGGAASVGGIFGSVFTANQAMTNTFFTTGADGTSTSAAAGTIGTNMGVPLSVTGAATRTLAELSAFTGFTSSLWDFSCHQPYLVWEGAGGCQPRISGGLVSSDGESLEVFFSTSVNPAPGSGDRYPSSSLFSVERNGNQVSTDPIEPGDSLRKLRVPFSSDLVLPDDTLAFSYTHPNPASNLPQFQALEARYGSQEDVRSRTLMLSVNSSQAGPVANIGSLALKPTSVEVPISCTGNCGTGDSFDYTVVITPIGGVSSTVVGTANATVATISFTALTPNKSHLVEASVSFSGVTSPTVSTTSPTPKPIATISALAVADTSATLTVGCTNCGADPDSFTISATPQGGGAAITSNTNVISGLTSETTYSFAVVIAFAGTTSDSVNWHPVMTLPFVPIITEVSPDQVPLTGGTITITGSNLSTSSLVMIGSTSSAFTIVSSTSMTVSATEALAGSYDISITNPVGTFTLSNAITYVSGPSLTTNSPVLATTNGGTIVTLTGTDLATTTQVNVGSTTVSFSVISNTTLRFVTAATSAGILDVGVETIGGAATRSNGLEFTDSALVPVVSSITPATGPIAGGTTVTITGQFFSGSYSDSVSAAINGVSGSSLVLIDDSTLTFVTPAHAEGTGFDVTVLTGGGLGTLAGAFSYTAPPVTSAGVGSGPAVILSTPEIITFSTRQLPASGGQITAEGRRLADISSMTLGGIRVTIVSNTDTSVTFTVLEMPVGTWDLRLVGVNGTLTFQQAITIVGQEVLLESTPGTMLGFTMTLRFTGNNRTLNVVQERNLSSRLDRFSTAETIICWGYTTSANPNAWAIAHATARAKAACDLAIGSDSALKSVVRLRYGVSKDFAMRAALQFWR
jgi:hypothetical protein